MFLRISTGIFIDDFYYNLEYTMASNPDLVQYIADQCAGAGEITVKKMFGDYGVSRKSCYRTYGHRCVFN